VEDISVDEYASDTSMSKAEITDLYSGRSVEKQIENGWTGKLQVYHTIQNI
jgi:hypothetical protein